MITGCGDTLGSAMADVFWKRMICEAVCDLEPEMRRFCLKG